MLMTRDYGWQREGQADCEVEDFDGVAGQCTCPECGGDGDWTKFYPHPEDLTEPMACVECKGTGRIWISI